MDRLELSLFVVGLVITIIGSGCYNTVTVSHPPRIPTGTIHVGIRPREVVNITRTIFQASVTANSLEVAIEFESEKLHEYHMYVLIPFLVKSCKPFVAQYDLADIFYYDKRYSGDPIGKMNSSFLTNSSLVSSVVTASFAPNATFFEEKRFYQYKPKQKIVLGIEISVDAIAAWSQQATDTVLLTFFGFLYVDDKMLDVINMDFREGKDRPFVVRIEFPVEAVLANTYPSPMGYFVTRNFQVVMFLMDFAKSGQTAYCSFTYPLLQRDIEYKIFLSGILIAMGLTVAIDSGVPLLRGYLERSKQTRLTKKSSCLVPCSWLGRKTRDKSILKQD